MSANLPLISRENYTFLKQYILRESGIVVEDGKEYFLNTRLAPVMKEQSVPNLDALCTVVRKTPSVRLKQAIVESVTIHETSFFRDESAFDALKFDLLPKMVAGLRPNAKLRVWSAASSSGQEAYSLAIIFLELGLDRSRFEILATDLSTQIVERARKGIYSKVEVQRGVSSQRMRHFVAHPEGWQLSDEIRRTVRFETLDLRNIPSTPEAYDLVVCRNVLIYFDMPTKLKILKSITESLAPGGYFLLGTAESLVNLDVPLAMTMIRNARFYQHRKDRSPGRPPIPAGKSLAHTGDLV